MKQRTISQQPQQVQDLREVPSAPSQFSSAQEPGVDYDDADEFQSWQEEDIVDQERLFEAGRAFEDLGGGENGNQ